MVLLAAKLRFEKLPRAEVKLLGWWWILGMAGALACSSPSKVEVRPNPMILEGKGTEGKLTWHIFDSDGKELTKKHGVTLMCLDRDTIRLHQDGTVVALSSGKTVVDVEIVGSETPGLPGTGIHAMADVIVKIPGWIEMSQEQIILIAGSDPVQVWAELRNDQNHTMRGVLPKWKVDNSNIVSVSPSINEHSTRVSLKLTPLVPGETYVSAYHGELAGDIQITVLPPPPLDTDSTASFE